MPIHLISSALIDFKKINEIISSNAKLELSDDAVKKIIRCREYLDNKMQGNDEAFYGINTGFGALYNKKISNGDLSQLQYNLVCSHACGTGDEVPNDLVKLMLLLKIQGLSYGNSGVQLETVQRLIDFYNIIKWTKTKKLFLRRQFKKVQTIRNRLIYIRKLRLFQIQRRK